MHKLRDANPMKNNNTLTNSLQSESLERVLAFDPRVNAMPIYRLQAAWEYIFILLESGFDVQQIRTDEDRAKATWYFLEACQRLSLTADMDLLRRVFDKYSAPDCGDELGRCYYDLARSLYKMRRHPLGLRFGGVR